MFLERCLIFLMLGFFVFIADVGQWSSRSGVIMFAFNYITWFVLIALTLRLSLRRIGSTKTSNYSTSYSTSDSTNDAQSDETDHSAGADSPGREMT